MGDPKPETSDRRLSRSELALLRRAVHEHGEEATRTALGTGRLSFARLLAGLPVLRSTLTVARAGLQEFAASETP